jgi:hypothetical protein
VSVVLFRQFWANSCLSYMFTSKHFSPARRCTSQPQTRVGLMHGCARTKQQKIGSCTTPGAVFFILFHSRKAGSPWKLLKFRTFLIAVVQCVFCYLTISPSRPRSFFLSESCILRVARPCIRVVPASILYQYKSIYEGDTTPSKFIWSALRVLTEIIDHWEILTFFVC